MYLFILGIIIINLIILYNNNKLSFNFSKAPTGPLQRPGFSAQSGQIAQSNSAYTAGYNGLTWTKYIAINQGVNSAADLSNPIFKQYIIGSWDKFNKSPPKPTE